MHSLLKPTQYFQFSLESTIGGNEVIKPSRKTHTITQTLPNQPCLGFPLKVRHGQFVCAPILPNPDHWP